MGPRTFLGWIVAAAAWSLAPASACGSCVRYLTDWHFPFMKWWSLAFVIWLAALAVLHGIARKQGLVLPLPLRIVVGTSLGIWLLGTLLGLGCSLFGMTLLAGPWLVGMGIGCGRARRWAVPRPLRVLFWSLQIGTLLACGATWVYARATFDSTARLISKLAYPKNTGPAEQRLIAQGPEAVPALIQVIRLPTPDPNYLNHFQVANALRVLEAIGDPRAAPAVAQLLTDWRPFDGPYKPLVYINACRCLAVLDPDEAVRLLPRRLEELKRQPGLSEHDRERLSRATLESLEKARLRTRAGNATRNKVTPSR